MQTICMIQKIICFNVFIQICSFPPIMSNLTTKHRPTEQNGHQQTFWTQIILLSEDIVNVRAYDLSQQDWTLSPPVITWFLLIELFPPLSLSEVGWWRNSGEMFGQAGGRREVCEDWGELRWEGFEVRKICPDWNTKDFLVLLSAFLLQLWFGLYMASDSSSAKSCCTSWLLIPDNRIESFVPQDES